ncbi:hypothetical protein [Vagococcus fessus]|uniref:Uncharacterized protein n=1 Tax=Vagococcus fessus TaxID=120370 RepID=A0A430A6F9_9ENTE|nr:hypothetical protein [Vagococcus fessus]RSU02472.1 hypothetical protein CBF31_08885 [Vagococcus fessus]
MIYEKSTKNKIEKLVCIETMSELKKFLKCNEERYIEYNISEGRFPNGALECYYSYVFYLMNELEEMKDDKLNHELSQKSNLSDISSKGLIDGPSPKKEKENSSIGKVYPRNSSEAIQAKIKSDWLCKADRKHLTFKS